MTGLVDYVVLGEVSAGAQTLCRCTDQAMNELGITWKEDSSHVVFVDPNFIRIRISWARHIVNPPPPQLVPLKDIRLPQPGILIPLITVKGEVVQDEVPRTIPNGQLVRNIKLKEGSIIRPVALWNKATTSPIKTGDIVTFSHVSPKKDKFLKELSLSTTSRTNITIETPQRNSPLGMSLPLKKRIRDCSYCSALQQ
ncbi:hypothetical protein BSL78_04007 [Apostichopus japonicus]|uniref:Uncharacterized protein n=1 Tax=Stichopus japonicus TaxID=307972 RepID=A0A2G8LFV6_STIJA|nr:hypothetical protein BSL78_04007 [Apostichopus japonicus]